MNNVYHKQIYKQNQMFSFGWILANNWQWQYIGISTPSYLVFTLISDKKNSGHKEEKLGEEIRVKSEQ